MRCTVAVGTCTIDTTWDESLHRYCTRRRAKVTSLVWRMMSMSSSRVSGGMHTGTTIAADDVEVTGAMMEWVMYM